MTNESKGLGTESSEGSADLGDAVGERPEMPAETEGLRLGNPREFDDSADDQTDREEYLFGAIEIFEQLSHEEIREIIAASTSRTVSAGEPLFEQGDEADALYIVVNGELQVRANTPVGEEVVLAVLGSGTIVGEMSLLDGGPRSAAVYAIADSTVYRLSREAFNELRDERRPAAYKVILQLASVLIERRRQTDARIEEVFDDPASHIDTFQNQVHEMLARMRKA
jgi:CRP-like cAMP-binding protein